MSFIAIFPQFTIIPGCSQQGKDVIFVPTNEIWEKFKIYQSQGWKIILCTSLFVYVTNARPLIASGLKLWITKNRGRASWLFPGLWLVRNQHTLFSMAFIFKSLTPKKVSRTLEQHSVYQGGFYFDTHCLSAFFLNTIF